MRAVPVVELLVEGHAPDPEDERPAQGLDLRVVRKLLGGLCGVRPCGSKYKMDARVREGRARGRPGTYAILDGDYRYPWRAARPAPEPWLDEDGELLGWRWSRKEIENYLLDPGVVGRALGLAAERQGDYAEALGRACGEVAVYQAARTALSSVRPKPNTLDNRWGRKRGSGRYLFPDPADRTEAACLQRMQALIERRPGGYKLSVAAQAWYRDECLQQGTAPEQAFSAGDLVQLAQRRFQGLLPECLPGGARHQEALVSFAGKDLLWALEGDLGRLGFGSGARFLERVTASMEASAEDVWTWLPEWAALRGEVAAQP